MDQAQHSITQSGYFHFGPQGPFHFHENENALSDLLLLQIRHIDIHKSSNYRQQSASVDSVQGE